MLPSEGLQYLRIDCCDLEMNGKTMLDAVTGRSFTSEVDRSVCVIEPWMYEVLQCVKSF